MFKKISILFIVSIVILPGCSSLKVKQYNQKTLTPLNPQVNFKTKIEDVSLRARKFTQVDCFRLFGERGKKLITHKHKTSIYPIQLSIYNKSDTTYVLKKKNIDLRLMQYRHVAHRMQHSTALRTIGLFFSGAVLSALTLIGGLAALGIGIMTTLAPVAIIGATACASAPFMLLIGTPINTTVNGVKSLRANTFIKKDVKDKSLAYQLIIKPGQNIDTVIFVKGKHYKNTFDLTLYDQARIKDDITFSVHLQASAKQQASHSAAHEQSN